MPALPFPFAAGDYPADKVDPDYLYFLRHLRPDGHSYVLELPSDGASPPSVLKYEPPIANSDGECVSDPSPGRASTNRRMEEKDSSVEAEAEADPSWLDSLADIDEDYRLFLQHTRVVNDLLVLEIGGVIVNYDPDAARSGGSSVVEEEETMGEKEAAIASSRKRVGVGDSDEPVIVVPEPKTWDWRADPTSGQKVEDEEDEGLLNASALRTPETTKREKSLSNGYDAEPHVASNIGQEDQFSPWRDDHRHYKVIPLTGQDYPH